MDEELLRYLSMSLSLVTTDCNGARMAEYWGHMWHKCGDHMWHKCGGHMWHKCGDHMWHNRVHMWHVLRSFCDNSIGIIQTRLGKDFW